MSLVYRNGRPRFQRSIREGDRVRTEYMASGENALLMATITAVERVEQDIERADEEGERESLEAAERPIVEYFTRVEDLARTALYASGYHQHKRQWRKRRGHAQEL